jgi:hypothetical protein
MKQQPYICTFTETHLVETKLAIEFRSIIPIDILNKYRKGQHDKQRSTKHYTEN